NRGFAVGCNEGSSRGQAPYVLFLNPDATIEPSALWQLIKCLEKDAKIAAIVPRLVNADGTLQHSLRRFPRLRSVYAEALFMHRVAPRLQSVSEVVRTKQAYERAAPVEWAMAACLLIRRHALECVGGFDEGFLLYREDADLCKRLSSAGYEIW